MQLCTIVMVRLSTTSLIVLCPYYRASSQATPSFSTMHAEKQGLPFKVIYMRDVTCRETLIASGRDQKKPHINFVSPMQNSEFLSLHSVSVLYRKKVITKLDLLQAY